MENLRNDSHWETVFDDEFPLNESWGPYDFNYILFQAWEAFRKTMSEEDILDRDSLSKKLSDIIKEKVEKFKARVYSDENVCIYTTLLSANTMQRNIIVIEVRDGREITYNRAIMFQFIKDRNELKGIYNDLQFLEGLLLKDKYENCQYVSVVNFGQSDKIFVNIYDIDERKDYYYVFFNIHIGMDRFTNSGHNDGTDKEYQNNSIDADVRIPKYLLKKADWKFL